MSRIAIPLDIVHIIYDHVDCWNTRLAIALTCKELNHILQGSVTNLAFQVFPTENDKACRLAYITTTAAIFDLHNSSFYLNQAQSLGRNLQKFSRLQTLLVLNSKIPVKLIHRVSKILVDVTPHLEVVLDYDDMDRWIQAFKIRHRIVAHDIKVSCCFRRLLISSADDGQSQDLQPGGEGTRTIGTDNESRSDPDSNELCETEPGDYSLGSKRPYHDYWDTPSDVDNRTREFKMIEKIRSIDFGIARVRNKESGSLADLPRALDKLKGSDIKYTSVPQEPAADEFLSSAFNAKEMLDSGVATISSKYVEAILLSKRIWVYITHFDSFVQHGRGFDDCAIPRKLTQEDGKPKAYIIDKNEYAATWKEIVIRVGRLELLVLGGFMGEIGSKKRLPFLGPSLNADMIKLIDENEEFRILIPSTPVSLVRSNRCLRSYHRMDSSRLWSFESARYAKTNFRLCHPLAYDMHPSRKAAIHPTAASLTSASLCIMTERRYSQSRPSEIFELLAKTKDGQSAIKRYPNALIENLSDYLDIITTACPMSRLIRPLKLLVKFDTLLQEKKEINITAQLNLVSSEALALYKDILSPALQQGNHLIINAMK